MFSVQISVPRKSCYETEFADFPLCFFPIMESPTNVRLQCVSTWNRYNMCYCDKRNYAFIGTKISLRSIQEIFDVLDVYELQAWAQNWNIYLHLRKLYYLSSYVVSVRNLFDPNNKQFKFITFKRNLLQVQNNQTRTEKLKMFWISEAIVSALIENCDTIQILFQFSINALNFHLK